MLNGLRIGRIAKPETLLSMPGALAKEINNWTQPFKQQPREAVKISR
jgi:hypothetical protein